VDGIDLDDKQRTYFRKEQIIHLRSRMIDGLYGYSNLVAGASSMGLFKAITDYQTRLYKTDASLRGVFQKKDEAPLSEEAYKRLRQQMAEAMTQLRDKGKPIVLEQGMEFNKIAMNADQAEAVKGRDQAIVDVCRLFRIPPHKAMHLINVKYENMETLEKSYLSDTMVPYFVNVEERLKRDLLVSRADRARYFPWFDREAIELHDPEKQAKVIETMIKHGAMTVDEARHRRGMNPLPNGAGKARLIPSTYTLIGENGEVLVQAAGQSNDSGTAEETEDGK
jgi:HK97 family phage portal protein